eukprot:SAG11_NODE_10343_length_838_cov_1.027064_2_plen_22_part_01
MAYPLRCCTAYVIRQWVLRWRG